MTNSIYRFKIKTPELYNSIIEFSKCNRHKNNEDIKTSFLNWYNSADIKQLVSNEENILIKNNYDLNKTPLQDKIYKSIKYYHIKKLNDSGKFKNKKMNKGTNITFSKDFISVVQQHINNTTTNTKPSDMFDSFVTSNQELIMIESRNSNKSDLTDDEFNYKLKKMFKNQYFMLFNKDT